MRLLLHFLEVLNCVCHLFCDPPRFLTEHFQYELAFIGVFEVCAHPLRSNNRTNHQKVLGRDLFAVVVNELMELH